LVSKHQLKKLKVMESQYQKISNSLRSDRRWKSLTGEFPHLQKLVSEFYCNTEIDTAKLREKILRLYSQYVEEWHHFTAREWLSPVAFAA
jgi:hypothetical protein